MQIPLFPLHTVLAPGIALPLHVFEERYRVMVRRCLDASAPFGVVLIREGSEVAPRDGTTQQLAIAGVGTFAEIREASRYADGRWDVLAVGTGRFVVREVIADREPFLVAEVDPYPDEPDDPGEDDAEAADELADELAGRVTRRFVDYLRLLQPREEAEIAFRERGAWPEPSDDPEAARVALRIPEDPSALSYLLTGIVQVEPERKQALLEAASAEERLRDLDELLDRELMLLGARLAPFAVDRRGPAGSSN
jgi:Lon protease-like protein